MTKPIIITFANQKGGVGKSTTCALFGCFAVKCGKSVLVLDGDSQLSIMRRRRSETNLGKIPDKSFQIASLDMTDVKSMVATIKNVSKLEPEKQPDLILIDTPGSILPEGLIELLRNTHFVVVPFNYEKAVIQSTLGFIRFYFRLDKVTNRSIRKKDRLIFIPNHIDRNWGTAEEKKLWRETLKMLNDMAGKVTSIIPDYKVMTLWDTLEIYPRQMDAVKDAFNEIYQKIYGEYPPGYIVEANSDIDVEQPTN